MVIYSRFRITKDIIEMHKHEFFYQALTKKFGYGSPVKVPHVMHKCF